MKVTLKQRIYNKLPEGKRDKIVKTYHVLRTIKNVVCWTMVAVLAIVVVIFLTMRINGETPTLFGYTLQRVATGSMEPALHVGDVILGKSVDDVKTLEKGDIITFQGGAYFDNHHVTHRVDVKPYVNESGELVLQTKGDANDISDPVISADDVESVFVTKLEFLNAIYDFFLSPWGLIIFILLILFVFFDEVLNIGRIVTGNDGEEEEEDIGTIIERIQREEQKRKLEEQEKAKRKAVKAARSSAKRFKRKKTASLPESTGEPQDE